MEKLNKIPVKLAFVLAHLPHYRYGLFKELETRAEQVVFISDDESKDGSIASIPDGVLKRKTKVHNIWLSSMLWQSGVAKELRKQKPDVIVFTGDPKYLSTWFNAVLARVRGQHVLFWTIGWHRPDQGLRRLVRLAFYRLAHQLLIYGDNGRDLGISSGYPENRMKVVYNSCESLADTKTEGLELEQLPDGDRPVIGAVIRLSLNKGLDELIRSIAILKDQFGIAADCLIVGEGPARPELEELASELGVNLYLPGALYGQENLEQIYKRLTLTVVPKAAGLTVLQSLSAGTPVITVVDPHQQGPEFEAIQDGTTGSLIEHPDGASIAKACSEWIQRLTEDPNSTEIACRQAIRDKWSAPAQAGRMIQAIQSACG